MIYFDTSYLVRMYVHEPGTDSVRTFAKTNQLCCSQHGRTELIAAFHRRFREGRFTSTGFSEMLRQFRDEEESGNAVIWLQADANCFRRAERAYAEAGPGVFLRAADAMHLACAAENGLREIYSNDKHLLAAASLFKLKGKNIIS